MSGGRENLEELDSAAPGTSAPAPPRPPQAANPGAAASQDTAPQTLKIENDADPLSHHDRWHWRRKIRANPHQRRVYRGVVAVGGLLFVVLGLVTGPLPGPGGIPLILLGLAIWASEFHWAHRLMHWFKAQLKRFQGWTRVQQTLFWIAFFAICGLCGYAYMIVLGIPGWVPVQANSLLQGLPGL